MPNAPTEWIDVSSLHNWTLGEPLLDWLDEFGVAKGLIPETAEPGYVPEADYGLFVRRKAAEFEAKVLELVGQTLQIAEVNGARSNDDAFFQQTLRLMREGQEAIYQGLVRDYDLGIFGVPDLIIKGFALERLVPGCLDELDHEAYYVLDIKFKGLELNKRGDLAAKHAWERTQLALYENALAAMTHRVPSRAFAMGRRLSGKAGVGGGCLTKLGWVRPLDEKTMLSVQEGLQWRRDLSRFGADWTLDPLGDPRLRPKPNNKQDGPWHEVKKQLLPESQQATTDNVPISPVVISANRARWHSRPQLEFFVDFETLNGMNDDFSEFPLAGGKPMIFMIGCGHEEDGDFRFTVWTALEETFDEERRIIQAWQDHMKETQLRLAPDMEDPLVHHWYRHEVTELASAAERHDEPEWCKINWFDLLKDVMQAEPVVIDGISSQSLKPVTRRLHELGFVNTIWPESSVEGGLEAMTAAWACYANARILGIAVHEVPASNGVCLMPEIEAYNEVDCKAMWEILCHLRRHH